MTRRLGTARVPSSVTAVEQTCSRFYTSDSGTVRDHLRALSSAARDRGAVATLCRLSPPPGWKRSAARVGADLGPERGEDRGGDDCTQDCAGGDLGPCVIA